MPIRFWWKPRNAPVSASAHRVDIGLELGGDDASISSPTNGRIRIVEVRGGQSSTRGSGETTSQRQVANFHGKFHRDASAPRQTRLSFEIDIGSRQAPVDHTGQTLPDHDGEVRGFDPECMLGIDALVLSFVNRQFRIFLPFEVDTHTEGTFLEFQAIAEIEQGGTFQALGRPSAVLNLRVRRHPRTVTTTSSDPVTGGSMQYQGRVIGNVIAYHENYLTQGAFKNAAAPWPQSVAAQFIPMTPNRPLGGFEHQVTFSAYTPGSLRIVLMDDLFEELIPDQTYLQREFPSQTFPQFTNQLRTQARQSVQTALTTAFTDGGFARAQVLGENDPAATALVTAFRGAFRHNTHSHQWSLRNGNNPLSVAYWDFFVVGDEGISPVGEGGNALPNVTTVHGGREYLLSYPIPIGSGNKNLAEPCKVRSSFFASKITQDASGGRRSYASRTDFDRALDRVARKLAIVVAHEVAHNLGLMHHMKVPTSGHYSENNGSPVLSMMSSSVDTSTFGLDMRFPAQAKAMWQAAFGVTPTFASPHLQNKTWTAAEVATVDWGDRKNRLFRQHDEIGMTSVSLTVFPPGTPPFCGSGSNVQRGTFVPPPSTP